MLLSTAYEPSHSAHFFFNTTALILYLQEAQEDLFFARTETLCNSLPLRYEYKVEKCY